MEILKNKSVIAKKAHRCDFCGGKIEAGEHYQYQFTTDGGDTNGCYLHSKCYTAIQRAFEIEGISEVENMSSLQDTMNEVVVANGEKPAKYVKDLVEQFNNIIEHNNGQVHTILHSRADESGSPVERSD